MHQSYPDLRQRKDLLQIVIRPIPASVVRCFYTIVAAALILFGLLIGGWSNVTTAAFALWYLVAMWLSRRDERGEPR